MKRLAKITLLFLVPIVIWDLCTFVWSRLLYNPDFLLAVYPWLILSCLGGYAVVLIISYRTNSLRALFVSPLLVSFFVILILVNHVVLRLFIVDFALTVSDSMAPAYRSGDVVIYAAGLTPQRGNVGVWYGWKKSELLIKRVLALKGDVIEFNQSALKLNGKTVAQTPCRLNYPIIYENLLEEKVGETLYCVLPVMPAGIPTNKLNAKWHRAVVRGQFFIVGDNRSYSLDSRSMTWSFPLSKLDLRGVALGRSDLSLSFLRLVTEPQE